MKKKVLFVATVVKTHIMVFHLPYLKWFQEQGYETYVAAKNDYADPTQCVIPYCDHYINIEFARNPISRQNQKAYRELKSLIDKEEFSIVHCHTPVGGVLARLAARKSRKKGTKFIYTAHGFHFYTDAPLQNWLIYYPIERFCAHYTDTLITINQEDYKRAQRFACHDVHLINGIGIDLNKLQSSNTEVDKVRRKLGIPKDAFVLVSVGEIIKNKNHSIVIDAIERLNSNRIWYLLCGEGNLQSEYIKKISNFKYNKQILFLGFRKDIADILNASDVFVFPSIREGLSVSLMEAMACGKPCIVSDIRGNHDLIQNDKGGYLVKQNCEEYVESIQRLLNDPQKRDSFGMYNKERIKDYGLNHVLEQMSSIYRQYM